MGLQYNWESMDILYNNNLINQIVDKLFKNRRSEYSEYNLQSLLTTADISHEIIKVSNQNYEKLHASLFRKNPKADTCIVFMHGYGSNRLECSNLLRSFPEAYALCAFDFSGSGKSEGDLITYGMKEKEDINSILTQLRRGGFRKFILWGRSMGATSALLYCLHYRPQDVILQIIDSPFYSFEMIAFQIANKNVKAPEFVISFALQMAKKNCGKFQFNPFQIELSNVGDCTVPALFVYCEEDNVINPQNTQLICSKYRAVFEKLVIQENHNNIRNPSTVEKIYSFIDKYVKRLRIMQNTYFDVKKMLPNTPKKGHSRGENSFDEGGERNRSIRKGIERVAAQVSNLATSTSGGRRFDDYGIWVASKFQSEMSKTGSGGKKEIKQGKQVKDNSKRPHLSLSISASNKKGKQFNFSPSFLKQGEPNIYQFNAHTMASQKERSSKKITTVKSMRVSRCLNNSKYL